MARPAVGMTWTSDLAGRSSEAGENALRYMALLVEAGITPVLLTPGAGTEAVSRLDGLLLPGGPDIAPSEYGQERGEHLGPVAPELDALELEVFHAAHALHLPVLGICRGQQLLNVALGGTLHQHVAHPQWGEDPSAPVHEVTIQAGTRLHRVLGVDAALVNSGHHQAVDVIAPALTVAATSPDGYIEALEAAEQLLISVQWHPDEMPDAQTSRRLMAGFAQWMGMQSG
ncbi:MAG: gamma-glutamyl-gamma-aminobutyrate hydrolase family protein [Candidatus Dormibacteraeota bacterium]|nr:gamma-glutamyl-gamma-aminobutyrate hydrolase family protein [Candidatus Dormibacteraeota bacterium]